MEYKEIINGLRDQSLTLEEALMKLSESGLCPNLLNDDAGRWAVATSGFQTVPDDNPIDIESTFFVEARFWKDTPTEALIYSLEDE